MNVPYEESYKLQFVRLIKISVILVLLFRANCLFSDEPSNGHRQCIKMSKFEESALSITCTLHARL